MDFSFLLGGNQVQLPDPTQQFARGLTLADMARRVQNSEDDYRMKDIERRANVLAAQAWGQAQQTGDIRSAVSDLSNQGEAGALALQKLTNAWRAEQESQAKQEHQRAQTQELMSKAEKGRFDVTQGRSVELRNMATAIAGSQGALPDEAIGTFMEGARALGVPENVLRQAPMQSDAFRQWAVTIADPKVLSDVTKEREITPAMVANYQASARKSNMDADMMPRETAAKEMTARASAQSAATGAARLKHDIGQADSGKWVNDLERGLQVNMATGETRPITDGGAPVGLKKDGKLKQMSERALSVLDLAEPIIDKATGSYAGAGIDLAARTFGKSTSGATAIAELQALEGALMLNQPRMEGPQSNLDVALYKQMAARIGDDTVPREQKKQALKVIRQLHEKYSEIAQGGAGSAGGSGAEWEYRNGKLVQVR